LSIIRDCVLDVASQYGGAPPGLVTTYDKSRYHNDGTLANITWAQIGDGLWMKRYNAVSSAVDLGSPSATIGLRRAGTIIAWVKANSSSGTRQICSDYRNVPTLDGLQFRFSDTNTVAFFARNADVLQFNVSTTDTVDTTRYHMIVGRYDTSNVYIDIDGSNSITDTVDATSGIGVSHLNLFIGKYPLGNTSWWDGDIGFFRIFNYALTIAQVRAYYHKTKWLFGVPV